MNFISRGVRDDIEQEDVEEAYYRYMEENPMVGVIADEQEDLICMFCHKTLICCIYPAYKYYNANNCWHCNIYKQDEFDAQLS